MKSRWRIINTGPADACTNMALDETLLHSYSTHSSLPTFRVYGWEPAALSLGYAQDARKELGIEAPVPFVRRITGGGIIHHGNELTYSLVCAKADLGIPDRVISSYKIISSFLIKFYKRLGLDAAFACDVAVPGERFGIQSALCSVSKEKYDIVVGGIAWRKIGGNAQRRSRNVIFQHGSIPFGLLEELLGRPVESAALSQILIETFAATFGVTAEEGRLSESEEAIFRDLKTRKYQRQEWNFDRIDHSAYAVEQVEPIQPRRLNGLARPSWINKKISLGGCASLKTKLGDLKLSTVCEEAICPNIGECFASGRATFLILGKNCTRHCTFCAVKRGAPTPLDPDEPQRVAEGVRRLGLTHAVITSVTRDDLPDGGAQAFVDTVLAIRKLETLVTVELLVPDFKFNMDAIRKLVVINPQVLAHNIETVPRLYHEAREGADYSRSLGVLRFMKECNNSLPVKSGIMLGLGERDDEILQTFDDIAGTGCDFLSIGQYLAPSRAHFPVKEYIKPEKFDYFKERAMNIGFRRVESGPYVRSSYRAAEYL